MRYRLITFICLLIVLSVTGSHFGLWQWERARTHAIYKVIDGDTFYTVDDKIRIAGIDTPERGEPGYKEARDALAKLLSGSKVVVVEPIAKDRYARTVAKVYVDGKNVAELLREWGYAKKK